MSFDSRLSLIRELETRTERVYHEVNGNPGVSTPGGRQLIGNGKDENYRITLAPHGETNNKIEKADVVYQLTDNGQWTDETNVAIVGYAPRPIEYGPTFEVPPTTAKQFLRGKDVQDVQLDASDLDFADQASSLSH